MAASSGPSLRDRLEFGVFRLLRGLLRVLPERWADGVGSALGRFAGSVLRVRRDVVDSNLARAFPDLGARERARLATASYRHLGREAVATFRSYGSPEDVRSRTRVHGLPELREALERGRGVIAVTGHLGNWEVGGSAVAAQGVPVDAVVFRQRNRLFDRELVEGRRRLGLQVIRRGRAPREVLHSLNQGRVPALVGDQDAGRRGVFVDFFGTPASTARGAAVFSLRTGAPLFLGVALRAGPRGRPQVPARYDVHLEEVPFEPSGDLEDDVRRLTAAHTAVLERWVRRAPEQYFWVHKRWKTRPPGEEVDHGRAPEEPPV